MKRIIFYGLLIFIFSIGIGYYYSSIWKQNRDDIAIEYIETNEENLNETVETSQVEEKISHNAEFALKKYYDECGHFSFQYAELPNELINLTRNQVEELYTEWEVEEFSSNSLVLSQEINSICNEHYLVKLGNSNVEIYQVKNNGNLSLYKETDISKEYLTEDDILNLEKGVLVYGNGKLNSILEDFE